MFKILEDAVFNFNDWVKNEKWFDLLTQINNRVGVKNEDNLYYKSLFRDEDKVKYMFLSKMCLGMQEMKIDTINKKVSFTDTVNDNKVTEFLFDSTHSYPIVDEVCSYLIDHNIIRDKNKNGVFIGLSQHILQKLFNPSSIRTTGTVYFDKLSEYSPKLFEYNRFMLSLNVYEDQKTMEFIEKTPTILDAPTFNDFLSNLPKIGYKFFNSEIYYFIHDENSNHVNHRSIKIPYGTEYIHLDSYIEEKNLDKVLPIFIKTFHNDVFIYSLNGTWEKLREGVLSTRKLIKVK